MDRNTVEKRLQNVEETLRGQDKAIFGEWDHVSGSRKRGLVENVETLRDRMELGTKVLTYGLGPALVIIALKALGIDTAEFIPGILKTIAGVLIH